MRAAVSHHTTKEAAKAVIDARLPELVAQFGSSVSDLRHTDWQGDVKTFSFTPRGHAVDGTVNADETMVTVDAEVVGGMPLSWRIAQGVARSRIESVLREWFPD